MKESLKHFLKIWLNLTIACVLILLVIFVVPRIFILFMPFVIGALIAKLANPMVVFIEKHIKIKRKAISGVVIALAIAAVTLGIYVFLFIIIRETADLSKQIPEIWESIQINAKKIMIIVEQFVDNLPFDLNLEVDKVGDSISEFVTKNMSDLSTPTVEAIGNFAKNIPNAIIATIMCVLSAYFFLTEKNFFTNDLKARLPKVLVERWNVIYQSLIKSLGDYISAQFKIEIWIYIELVIGFAILDVEHILIIALGIALLDIFPIFGTGTVLVPWAIIELVDKDYKTAIGLIILWGTGQLLRQIIQPKIVGDSFGIPPLPTLLLLYIGWKLKGVMGMVVAVPIGIIIWNLNKVGTFDQTKDSIKILVKDISAFRIYTKADQEYHKRFRKEKDEHE